MKSFEDLGFYCLDNLPPVLLPDALDVIERAGTRDVAVALDVRTRGSFGDAIAAIDQIKAAGHSPELLFLEASDEVLVRRYSETRRRHPLGNSGALSALIDRERDELAPLRERAKYVWDTTGFTLNVLKDRIAGTFLCAEAPPRLHVVVLAFGFKHGVPLEADLVFDVRFLPNPNYVEGLKDLTGADPAVAEYLGSSPEVGPFMDHLYAFIDYLMPRFVTEGKSHLTIAIGCTGGRHRSVYVARQLGAHLSAEPALTVDVDTRDVQIR